MECISELRSKGYNVPLYPAEPQNAEEKEIQKKYSTILGSAVNPVLREGNSDRRVAAPVKAYAQKNPHRMGMWSKASRTHVAHMTHGDFYESELSVIMKEATDVVIEFTPTSSGEPLVMKASTPLEKGEVIDAAFLSVKALTQFYEDEIEEAKETELLLSLVRRDSTLGITTRSQIHSHIIRFVTRHGCLCHIQHLKATMMKISDPIMFGYCVKVFFKDAFEKHQAVLDEIGANPRNGLGSVLDTVTAKLPEEQAQQIIADFNACYEDRPWLAMVDSDKGITNLHVPSDVIIDASMPVVIRDSGKMWNKMGELEDTKCLIPDRCYATVYQEAISYVKTQGQFDVA